MRFKYGDVVEICDGFFEDCTGIVQDYYEDGEDVEYQVLVINKEALKVCEKHFSESKLKKSG